MSGAPKPSRPSADDALVIRQLIRELEAALEGDPTILPHLPRLLDVFRSARGEVIEGSDPLAGSGPVLGPLIDSAKVDFRLTPRECDVLELVAAGQSNRGIANNLGCSSRTVEVHVSRLLEKSGCGSRAELIARVWAQAVQRLN